jgi:hypothetical protein
VHPPPYLLEHTQPDEGFDIDKLSNLHITHFCTTGNDADAEKRLERDDWRATNTQFEKTRWDGDGNTTPVPTDILNTHICSG